MKTGKEEDKDMKKIVKYLVIFLIAVLGAFPAINMYMNLNHMHDYSKKNVKENDVLSFIVSDKSNEKSGARDMRICAINVNGEELNLDDYDNDEWVWHGEWNYILYQKGESRFDITLNKDIKKLDITYVKEAYSGIVDITLNDEKLETIDMYRSEWLTTSISLSYINMTDKILIGAQIAIVLFLVLLLIDYIITNFKKRNEPIKGIQKNLTMFDFAKGVGIIAIIAGHTFEAVSGNLESIQSSNGLLFGLVGVLVMYGMMPMFFIASGYGFRVANVFETTKKQIRFWIKPFLIVFIGTALVCAGRYVFDNSFGMEELKYNLLPFVFGQAHEGYRLGMKLFSIGPMWFGTALCFAWILLNGILNINNKYVRCVFGGIVILAGYYLSMHDFNVWCIPQIFYVMIILYAGYFIREKKIFGKEKKKSIMIYGVLALFSMIAGIANGSQIGIASAQWGTNYIVTIIVSVLSSVVILWLFLNLNPLLKNKLKHIKKIGRATYYIFYIHTFEWLVIPWNQIYKSLGINQAVSFVAILALRSLIIYAIYSCITKIKKRK